MFCPWTQSLAPLWHQKPSLGLLIDLSEENYRLLMRMIPQLKQLAGNYQIQGQSTMPLHLSIIEQTVYTTLMRLTYCFDQNHHPDALLRVYHDAKQIEVLDLNQTALPLIKNQGQDLIQRWQRQVFLSKWLRYCFDKHYFLIQK